MPNDVATFKGSRVSIAMGNASDAVKREATHVTGSNTEDGFTDAVETIVLPEALGSRRRQRHEPSRRVT